MIKTSGYRVSPAEIEEIVYDTGQVRDAVAFGIDDEAIGQAIVVAVSPLQGFLLEEADLIAELRKQLPLYMIPRKIVIRDELPDRRTENSIAISSAGRLYRERTRHHRGI